MDKVATIMLNTNGYFFSNEDHQVKLSTSFPLLSTGFGSSGYTINLRISCEYASTSLLRTWIKMFGNPSKLSRTLILDDVTNFGSNEEIVFKFLFLKGSFFKITCHKRCGHLQPFPSTPCHFPLRYSLLSGQGISDLWVVYYHQRGRWLPTASHSYIC